MITTSRDPSSRLKMFAKEMKLVVPGAQRMNRGRHEVGALLRACKANGVTDLLVLHEHRGQPDGLIISHLPFGPTAFFTLCNVVMRHEVPDIGTMSEATPHLIFHNFTSRLGQRVCSILKYLFPVPKEDSKRVITFANQDDYISFSIHDQAGHAGAGSHGRCGVALASLHQHGPQAAVPERRLRGTPGPERPPCSGGCRAALSRAWTQDVGPVQPEIAGELPRRWLGM
ncbi:U3 small nucleolar ribonucleoprotein IMP4 isoform X1 [Chelonoidis abingdonii]|uniref:U3 small nucleolar ribonucleoprotein IMP4 isoform X1 n=1 Tax=Chelonoidis abingdonii TaxID=106734 RepID=UPI003F498EFF